LHASDLAYSTFLPLHIPAATTSPTAGRAPKKSFIEFYGQAALSFSVTNTHIK
jgi:hypothetical protein